MDREHPVSAWSEWKIIEKIGEGSFGKVYKAQRDERGKTFYSAIKVINIPGSQGELNSVRSETGDDNSVREYFRNLVEECIQEVSTMEYFRGNSHIVSVEDFKVMEYLDDIGWEISIRMEYLTSFMDYCAEKELTEKEVIQLGLDLSKALEYCAKLKIIHRDIKPENIFVSRFGDFKLGDFGIARELERTMSGLSKKGTYSYMAPEMYKGEKYDSRVDIYSLGIVLYKLMNHNRLPFLNLEKQFITYRDKENALTRRISGEKLKKPVDAGEEFSRIILKACAYNPDERYQKPEEFYHDLDDLKNGRVEGSTKAGEALKQEVKQMSQKPTVPVSENPKPEKAVSAGKNTDAAGAQKESPKSGDGKQDAARNTETRKQKSQNTEVKKVPPRNTEVKKVPPRNLDMTRISDRNPEENRVLVRNVEAYRASVKNAEDGRTSLKEARARRTQAGRKRKKQRNTSSWALLVALGSLAAMIVFAIYIMIRVNSVQLTPKDNMVNMLQDEKYKADKNIPEDFATQIDTIKERATTIVDDLEMQKYDWIGQEGDKISYYDHDTGKYMKVLVYPGRSEDKVYEEYYYWDEQLFFAYIWYDTTADLYYYDDGKLIRWIDKDGTCHDNETDNKEYVERGKKYWEKSVKELQ